MNIQQALCEAKKVLACVTDQPLLEAEILLAYVMNQSRVFLHARPETHLNAEQIKPFTDFIQRRCSHEPIAYIIQRREFWSLEFLVSPKTLIPRPETELLVESVLQLMGENSLDHCSGHSRFEGRRDQGWYGAPRAGSPFLKTWNGRNNGRVRENTIKVADLGTGSGAIGLSIAHEKKAWQIHAVDICDGALQMARTNAKTLRIENVSFYQGNWCQALPCTDFDVMVSNPPYIAETEWEKYAKGLTFEPSMALVSGRDGLDAIRQISQSAKYYLKPKGYILVEHGFSQAEAVRQLFNQDGYHDVYTIRDLAGHERVTIGQK